MEDIAFDTALVAAAFELAAGRGWARVTVADAARHAGLALDRARSRFPNRTSVLLRFGRLADMAALGSSESAPEGSERDRLFDMVMRRIDVLQAHRDGVQALLRYLPTDPGAALLLAMGTGRSMAWLLDAAGLRSTGAVGALRVQGMLAVWLWTVRAWQRDEGADLSATMAALDTALTRAEQAEASLPGGRRAAPSSDMGVVDPDLADVVLEPELPLTDPPPAASTAPSPGPAMPLAEPPAMPLATVEPQESPSLPGLAGSPVVSTVAQDLPPSLPELPLSDPPPPASTRLPEPRPEVTPPLPASPDGPPSAPPL